MNESDLLLCCRGHGAKYNHYEYPDERPAQVVTEDFKKNIQEKARDKILAKFEAD
tara:strand:+ start:1600 stop:1764 length:165 start_codon:yes stop_codon:yes gene_type:complete